MHILFIDNFDSFSHTLADEFARREATLQVWRNDLPAEKLAALALAMPTPRLLVLSPGPGKPSAAGNCSALVKRLAGKVPVFGVCLGHQVLVETFGGKVGPAGEIVHGKTSSITHDNRSFFAGLPSPLTVGRYHSLAALQLPLVFIERARVGNLNMAIEHESLALAGVQFHPESILTPQGGLVIESIMRWAGQRSVAGTEKSTCTS